MPQPTHDTLPSLSTQLQALIQHGWEQEVLAQLPVGYEQQARKTGAFVRAGALTCVADLLRGLLAYVLSAPPFAIWARGRCSLAWPTSRMSLGTSIYAKPAPFCYGCCANCWR